MPPAPSAPRRREDPPARRRRARAILSRLARAYPDWGPTLEFSSPFQLLVATILAAQAQDEHINRVTRALFEKYRGPADYLRVPVEELERDVHATGFFRMKAKAIRGASEQLLTEFGGEVPGDMDSLVRLRGVGRKTASIVLGNAFKVPAIAVDRHVHRVATRLGFTRKGTDGVEMELRSLYPRKDWVKATWTLVLHGRRTCTPTPKCPVCPVSELCPYPKKTRQASALRPPTTQRTTRPASRPRSPARRTR
ncbi:MAG TPA: endonuclease III [Candidatus Limnocylindria bacterium]|nr:endonuclease III [Candidatus Limnocylindria bacterium]